MAPTPTSTPEVDEEIMVSWEPAELQVGESVTLGPGGDLTFKYEYLMLAGVSDDRCPTHEDVACAWEGALQATFRINTTELTIEGFEDGNHGSSPHAWFQVEDEWFRLTAEGFSPLGETPRLQFRIDAVSPESVPEDHRLVVDGAA